MHTVCMSTSKQWIMDATLSANRTGLVPELDLCTFAYLTF
jgi:hypothetical protein